MRRSVRRSVGDGTTTSSSNPVTANISGVIAVAQGYAHTCVLLASSEVRCVGYNFYGQLGNGSTQNSTSWVTPITGAIAIAAGYNHTCALLGSGQVACWGYNGLGGLGNGTNTSSSVPVFASGF
jgi:alpha-tubulin suppressor-like RCC1 family protein